MGNAEPQQERSCGATDGALAPAALQDGGSHWFQHLCGLCSAPLPSKGAVREPWHWYIGSSGIVSLQLTPLTGWGTLSPSGNGANLSSPPGMSHRAPGLATPTPGWLPAVQLHRQMANVTPRGPGPPKHYTHLGGLGLRNPLSRTIQVQDISLN